MGRLTLISSSTFEPLLRPGEELLEKGTQGKTWTVDPHAYVDKKQNDYGNVRYIYPEDQARAQARAARVAARQTAPLAALSQGAHQNADVRAQPLIQKVSAAWDEHKGVGVLEAQSRELRGKITRPLVEKLQKKLGSHYEHMGIDEGRAYTWMAANMWHKDWSAPARAALLAVPTLFTDHKVENGQQTLNKVVELARAYAAIQQRPVLTSDVMHAVDRVQGKPPYLGEAPGRGRAGITIGQTIGQAQQGQAVKTTISEHGAVADLGAGLGGEGAQARSDAKKTGGAPGATEHNVTDERWVRNVVEQIGQTQDPALREKLTTALVAAVKKEEAQVATEAAVKRPRGRPKLKPVEPPQPKPERVRLTDEQRDRSRKVAHALDMATRRQNTAVEQMKRGVEKKDVEYFARALQRYEDNREASLQEMRDLGGQVGDKLWNGRFTAATPEKIGIDKDTWKQYVAFAKKKGLLKTKDKKPEGALERAAMDQVREQIDQGEAPLGQPSGASQVPAAGAAGTPPAAPVAATLPARGNRKRGPKVEQPVDTVETPPVPPTLTDEEVQHRDAAEEKFRVNPEEPLAQTLKTARTKSPEAAQALTETWKKELAHLEHLAETVGYSTRTGERNRLVELQQALSAPLTPEKPPVDHRKEFPSWSAAAAKRLKLLEKKPAEGTPEELQYLQKLYQQTGGSNLIRPSTPEVTPSVETVAAVTAPKEKHPVLSLSQEERRDLVSRYESDREVAPLLAKARKLKKAEKTPEDARATAAAYRKVAEKAYDLHQKLTGEAKASAAAAPPATSPAAPASTSTTAPTSVPASTTSATPLAAAPAKTPRPSAAADPIEERRTSLANQLAAAKIPALHTDKQDFVGPFTVSHAADGAELRVGEYSASSWKEGQGDLLGHLREARVQLDKQADAVWPKVHKLLQTGREVSWPEVVQAVGKGNEAAAVRALSQAMSGKRGGRLDVNAPTLSQQKAATQVPRIGSEGNPERVYSMRWVDGAGSLKDPPKPPAAAPVIRGGTEAYSARTEEDLLTTVRSGKREGVVRSRQAFERLFDRRQAPPGQLSSSFLMARNMAETDWDYEQIRYVAETEASEYGVTPQEMEAALGPAWAAIRVAKERIAERKELSEKLWASIPAGAVAVLVERERARRGSNPRHAGRTESNKRPVTLTAKTPRTPAAPKLKDANRLIKQFPDDHTKQSDADRSAVQAALKTAGKDTISANVLQHIAEWQNGDIRTPTAKERITDAITQAVDAPEAERAEATAILQAWQEHRLGDVVAAQGVALAATTAASQESAPAGAVKQPTMEAGLSGEALWDSVVDRYNAFTGRDARAEVTAESLNQLDADMRKLEEQQPGDRHVQEIRAEFDRQRGWWERDQAERRGVRDPVQVDKQGIFSALPRGPEEHKKGKVVSVGGDDYAAVADPRGHYQIGGTRVSVHSIDAYTSRWAVTATPTPDERQALQRLGASEATATPAVAVSGGQTATVRGGRGEGGELSAQPPREEPHELADGDYAVHGEPVQQALREIHAESAPLAYAVHHAVLGGTHTHGKVHQAFKQLAAEAAPENPAQAAQVVQAFEKDAADAKSTLRAKEEKTRLARLFEHVGGLPGKIGQLAQRWGKKVAAGTLALATLLGSPTSPTTPGGVEAQASTPHIAAASGVSVTADYRTPSAAQLRAPAVEAPPVREVQTPTDDAPDWAGDDTEYGSTDLQQLWRGVHRETPEATLQGISRDVKAKVFTDLKLDPPEGEFPSTGDAGADNALRMVQKLDKNSHFGLGLSGRKGKDGTIGYQCSSFASKAVGIPQMDTDSMYRDARKGHKHLRQVDLSERKAGDLILYPDHLDENGEHEEGHVAVIIDPVKMTIADASWSDNGVHLRKLHPNFVVNKKTIVARPLNQHIKKAIEDIA